MASNIEINYHKNTHTNNNFLNTYNNNNNNNTYYECKSTKTSSE